MAKSIDWNKIKVAYVTGNMSYKDLAKKHRIQPNSLARTAKAEGWPAQRKAYRAEAASRAISSEIDNEAKRLGDLIRATDCMTGVVLKLFEDAQQFHRHIVIDGFASEEKIFDKVDTKAIKDLTGALKDLTYVQRNLNNLPTQAERESQRIAAERLELDKQKAQIDKNTDRSVEIVFKTPDSEGFAE